MNVSRFRSPEFAEILEILDKNDLTQIDLNENEDPFEIFPLFVNLLSTDLKAVIYLIERFQLIGILKKFITENTFIKNQQALFVHFFKKIDFELFFVLLESDSHSNRVCFLDLLLIEVFDRFSVKNGNSENNDSSQTENTQKNIEKKNLSINSSSEGFSENDFELSVFSRPILETSSKTYKYFEFLVKVLIERLHDTSFYVRIKAIHCLGVIVQKFYNFNILVAEDDFLELQQIRLSSSNKSSEIVLTKPKFQSELVIGSQNQCLDDKKQNKPSSVPLMTTQLRIMIFENVLERFLDTTSNVRKKAINFFTICLVSRKSFDSDLFFVYKKACISSLKLLCFKTDLEDVVHFLKVSYFYGRPYDLQYFKSNKSETSPNLTENIETKQEIVVPCSSEEKILIKNLQISTKTDKSFAEQTFCADIGDSDNISVEENVTQEKTVSEASLSLPDDLNLTELNLKNKHTNDKRNKNKLEKSLNSDKKLKIRYNPLDFKQPFLTFREYFEQIFPYQKIAISALRDLLMLSSHKEIFYSFRSSSFLSILNKLKFKKNWLKFYKNEFFNNKTEAAYVLQCARTRFDKRLFHKALSLVFGSDDVNNLNKNVDVLKCIIKMGLKSVKNCFCNKTIQNISANVEGNHSENINLDEELIEKKTKDEAIDPKNSNETDLCLKRNASVEKNTNNDDELYKTDHKDNIENKSTNKGEAVVIQAENVNNTHFENKQQDLCLECSDRQEITLLLIKTIPKSNFIDFELIDLIIDFVFTSPQFEKNLKKLTKMLVYRKDTIKIIYFMGILNIKIRMFLENLEKNVGKKGAELGLKNQENIGASDSNKENKDSIVGSEGYKDKKDATICLKRRKVSDASATLSDTSLFYNTTLLENTFIFEENSFVRELKKEENVSEYINFLKENYILYNNDSIFNEIKDEVVQIINNTSKIMAKEENTPNLSSNDKKISKETNVLLFYVAYTTLYRFMLCSLQYFQENLKYLLMGLQSSIPSIKNNSLFALSDFIKVYPAYVDNLVPYLLTNLIHKNEIIQRNTKAIVKYMLTNNLIKIKNYGFYIACGDFVLTENDAANVLYEVCIEFIVFHSKKQTTDFLEKVENQEQEDNGKIYEQNLIHNTIIQDKKQTSIIDDICNTNKDINFHIKIAEIEIKEEKSKKLRNKEFLIGVLKKFSKFLVKDKIKTHISDKINNYCRNEGIENVFENDIYKVLNQRGDSKK